MSPEHTNPTDDQHHALEFDYAVWQAQFADRFWDALDQRLPEHRVKRDEIRERIANQLAVSKHLIADDAAVGHLELGALVLETHRALESVVPHEVLLEALRFAFVEPDRQAVQEGTRAALDHAENPFKMLTAISKDRETSYFGQSFVFEHAQDDGHANLVNIHKCIWNDFLREQQAVELMPIFCAYDHNWIEAIDTAQHSVRFERPTTLGTGGDCCRFWFIRTEPSMPS